MRVAPTVDEQNSLMMQKTTPAGRAVSEKASELRVQIEGLIKDSNRYC